MQRYMLTGTATFYDGILELTHQQAQPRSIGLDDLGDGLYLITAPVQFKRGEQLGYDGDVNKELLQSLQIKAGTATPKSRGVKA